jgi:hypothetical protein
MVKSKKGNNGCLWFFVVSLLSVFSFIIIKVAFSISTNIALTLAIAGSVLFLKLILGKQNNKNLVRSGIFIFLILYGLKSIFLFFLNSLEPNREEPITIIEEEKTTKTSIIKNQDTTFLYTSNRNWIDNYGNRYSGALSVREKDYTELKSKLDSYKSSSSKYFWGRLYDHLEQQDTPSLDLVMETFIQINNEKKLNQMEFAEMVVTCIQDIPYAFVLQNDCPSPEEYDDSNRTILENCPSCCIGNKKFGIQNPVSFIKNLKGDCDTRTVIVYSILKYFKYDVAIVNSNFYRHSIIGINLPASGYYKTYNGKKYVLWETTAMYYKAGALPASFNNVAHWNIVLTSK